jgi:hypothetical protein
LVEGRVAAVEEVGWVAAAEAEGSEVVICEGDHRGRGRGEDAD